MMRRGKRLPSTELVGPGLWRPNDFPGDRSDICGRKAGGNKVESGGEKELADDLKRKLCPKNSVRVSSHVETIHTVVS
jgi:hypothetical protein